MNAETKGLSATNPVHHIELWTQDLAAGASSISWLMQALGWRVERDPGWPEGLTWHHGSGAYLVLEQSPDVSGPHDRTRAGLNHLALRVLDRTTLDRIREECTSHGWTELFADRYPHAGGSDHVALFIVNAEGFEFELVVD